MKKLKFLLGVGIVLTLVFCLTGCGKKQTPADEKDSVVLDDGKISVILETHSISGEDRTEYRIPKNKTLDGAQNYEKPGCYWNWTMEDGTLVDPFLYVFTEDTTIHGECVPYVNMYVPFLSVREDRLIHPEELVTREDLMKCLQIWLESEEYRTAAMNAAEEAMGNGTEVTPSVLQAAVEGLFFSDQLQTALEAAGWENSERPLDRSTFAMIMVDAFGTMQYQISFDDLTWLPLDLDVNDAAMLIATQYYTIEVSNGYALTGNGTEKEITESFLEAVWPGGYTFLNGCLYYADETGTLLRDGMLGTHLYFGTDGRQTSGNDELDGYVAEHLMGYMREHPEMNRYEWLREAFDDVVWNVLYYPKTHPEFGDNCNDEWVIEFALEGLGIGTGDCYGSAACMTVLARGLGYDAHAISGSAFDQPAGPHAWTIIKIDPEHPLEIFPNENAKDYFYDPQMEAHKLIGGTTDNYGKDMFCLDQKYADWWKYDWYRPQYTCVIEE